MSIFVDLNAINDLHMSRTALPIERKFELIEQAFQTTYGTGAVPGTTLGRCLLPEKEGGVIGWCLGVGRMSQPLCFFYAKTINGAFAKARNAAAKGRITPQTIPLALVG